MRRFAAALSTQLKLAEVLEKLMPSDYQGSEWQATVREREGRIVIDSVHLPSTSFARCLGSRLHSENAERLVLGTACKESICGKWLSSMSAPANVDCTRLNPLPRTMFEKNGFAA